jgi:hypothetical protein
MWRYVASNRDMLRALMLVVQPDFQSQLSELTPALFFESLPHDEYANAEDLTWK